MQDLHKQDVDPIILHWNEDAQTWTKVAWAAWEKFRAFQIKFEPLPGIGAGDHFFVVCIVDEERTLFNIIPHRYRLDRDGHITDHHFHDLTPAERAKADKWQMSVVSLNDADQEAFDALRERIWKSHLPPADAATSLIRALPGFPASGEGRPVMSFLRAFGMTGSSRRVN